jgi:hypothetical protein
MYCIFQETGKSIKSPLHTLQEKALQAKTIRDSIHQQSKDICSYLQIYQNMCPSFQMNKNEKCTDNVSYNLYLLSRDMMVNPKINRGILDYFINQETGLLRVRRIFEDDYKYYDVGLGIITDEQNNFTRLYSVEYPTDKDVYIIIPQISRVMINGPV